MSSISNLLLIRDPRGVMAWCIAILISMLCVAILKRYFSESFEMIYPNYYQQNVFYVQLFIGGLLFGVGMTLAGGCTSRNIIKASSGDLSAIWVLAIVSVVSYGMSYTDFYSKYIGTFLNQYSITISQPYLSFSASSVAFSMAASIIVVGVLIALLWALYKRKAYLFIFSGVSLGSSVALLWALTAGPIGQSAFESAQYFFLPPNHLKTQALTTISPLADLWLWHSYQWSFEFITVGMSCLFGLLAGGFIAAFLGRELKSPIVPLRGWFRMAIGGVLMGIGGPIALGCTLGQGVSGLSLLALSSCIAVSGLIIGCLATTTIWYQRL